MIRQPVYSALSVLPVGTGILMRLRQICSVEKPYAGLGAAFNRPLTLTSPARSTMRIKHAEIGHKQE